MKLETATQTQAHTNAPAPASTLVASAPKSGLLSPVGMKDLSQRELYREFLRFPTFLWLPASISILVMIGMQSIALAVPCAPLLATAATLHAVHRACARMNSRKSTAIVTDFVPQPRTGFGR